MAKNEPIKFLVTSLRYVDRANQYDGLRVEALKKPENAEHGTDLRRGFVVLIHNWS